MELYNTLNSAIQAAQTLITYKGVKIKTITNKLARNRIQERIK